MAKVKNKRENHVTKRGTYGYGYGPKNAAPAKKSVSDRTAPKRENFARKKREPYRGQKSGHRGPEKRQRD